MHNINVTLLRFCYGCDACRWSKNETKHKTLTDGLCVQKCAESFRKRYLCFVISSLLNNAREVLRFFALPLIEVICLLEEQCSVFTTRTKKGITFIQSILQNDFDESTTISNILLISFKKKHCSVRLVSLFLISGGNNEFWMTFIARGQSFLKNSSCIFMYGSRPCQRLSCISKFICIREETVI